MKKQKGYWNYDRGKNMRSHLENVARLNGLDPLFAESWYTVSRQDFMQHRVSSDHLSLSISSLLYLPTLSTLLHPSLTSN